MRPLAAILLASVIVVGCNKSPDDEPPKPSTMANPSGKPQDDKQAAQATIQQQAGENAKAQMAAAAKAMKESQSHPGGN